MCSIGLFLSKKKRPMTKVTGHLSKHLNERQAIVYGVSASSLVGSSVTGAGAALGSAIFA